MDDLDVGRALAGELPRALAGIDKVEDRAGQLPAHVDVVAVDIALDLVPVGVGGRVGGIALTFARVVPVGEADVHPVDREVAVLGVIHELLGDRAAADIEVERLERADQPEELVPRRAHRPDLAEVGVGEEGHKPGDAPLDHDLIQHIGLREPPRGAAVRAVVDHDRNRAAGDVIGPLCLAGQRLAVKGVLRLGGRGGLRLGGRGGHRGRERGGIPAAAARKDTQAEGGGHQQTEQTFHRKISISCRGIGEKASSLSGNFKF